MNKFQLSFILFITTIVAAIFLGVSWVSSIVHIVKDSPQLENDSESVAQVFSTLFSPGLIISLVVLIISSLTFKVLAIVQIANAKRIEGGEKVLWIIGLFILGFITGILYLVFSYQKRFDNGSD